MRIIEGRILNRWADLRCTVLMALGRAVGADLLLVFWTEECWKNPGLAAWVISGRSARKTIVDAFKRFSPAIELRFKFRGGDVVEVLERVGREIGFPAAIRVDQGSEFVSRDPDLWAYQRGVTLDFSRSGNPTVNAFIESLDGKFRTEGLNAHWFTSLDDAWRKCEIWRRDYNEDHTAQPATRSRSSSSIDQRHSTRPDRSPRKKPGRWSKDGEAVHIYLERNGPGFKSWA
jgi:transposase InsO family protein